MPRPYTSQQLLAMHEFINSGAAYDLMRVLGYSEQAIEVFKRRYARFEAEENRVHSDKIPKSLPFK